MKNLQYVLMLSKKSPRPTGEVTRTLKLGREQSQLGRGAAGVPLSASFEVTAVDSRAPV